MTRVRRRQKRRAQRTVWHQPCLRGSACLDNKKRVAFDVSASNNPLPTTRLQLRRDCTANQRTARVARTTDDSTPEDDEDDCTAAEAGGAAAAEAAAASRNARFLAPRRFDGVSAIKSAAANCEDEEEAEAKWGKAEADESDACEDALSLPDCGALSADCASPRRPVRRAVPAQTGGEFSIQNEVTTNAQKIDVSDCQTFCIVYQSSAWLALMAAEWTRPSGRGRPVRLGPAQYPEIHA
jgi:hypothetical protein